MSIVAAGRMVAGALCKWFRPWLKPVALAHVGYLGGWRLRRSLVFREGGLCRGWPRGDQLPVVSSRGESSLPLLCLNRLILCLDPLYKVSGFRGGLPPQLQTGPSGAVPRGRKSAES